MRFSPHMLSAIVLSSMLALPASGGFAAPPEPAKKAEKESTKDESRKDPSRKKMSMPRNMPKIQELDAIEIVGRIQKPEVFYVLGRTDFSYKGLALKRSFVDRIGRSVRSNPF